MRIVPADARVACLLLPLQDRRQRTVPYSTTAKLSLLLEMMCVFMMLRATMSATSA